MTALGLASQQQTNEIIELKRKLNLVEADYLRLADAIKSILLGTLESDMINRADNGLSLLIEKLNPRDQLSIALTLNRLLGIKDELQAALNGNRS